MLVLSWKAVVLERTRLTVITGGSYISMSTSEKGSRKTNAMLGFLHSGNISNDNNRPLEMWSKVTTSCYVTWFRMIYAVIITWFI